MAHFAKLDENNKVIHVIVVNNDALDINNEEESGIIFLTNWSGGYSNWKQTSYNGTFRKNYAGEGFSYDPIRDAFIAEKPYEDWILDESTCRWIPPVPYPNDGNVYYWNQTSQIWENAE